MHFILILGVLFATTCAQASCLFSEKLAATLKEETVITLYKSCAEGMNDDGAQTKLAAIYEKGSPAIPKNIKKALFYYQLSAENGNAASQARLAQLYMEFDKSRENRAFLYDYMNSVIPTAQPNANAQDTFRGELVHPYILLMLANEKPENKWYYPSAVTKAPAYAATLFKNYKIDEEKKKQLTRQATLWKKRKLLEMARQILSEAEYQTFSETIYPTNGQADAFKRNQALKAFQEKVKQKKQQDAASAKTLY